MGALGRYRRRILKARGEPRSRAGQRAARRTVTAEDLRPKVRPWILRSLAEQAIEKFRAKQAEPPTPGPDFAARKRG